MQYQDKYLGFIIDYSRDRDDYQVWFNGQLVFTADSYDDAMSFVDNAVASRLPMLKLALA